MYGLLLFFCQLSGRRLSATPNRRPRLPVVVNTGYPSSVSLAHSLLSLRRVGRPAGGVGRHARKCDRRSVGRSTKWWRWRCCRRGRPGIACQADGGSRRGRYGGTIAEFGWRICSFSFTGVGARVVVVALVAVVAVVAVNMQWGPQPDARCMVRRRPARALIALCRPRNG